MGRHGSIVRQRREWWCTEKRSYFGGRTAERGVSADFWSASGVLDVSVVGMVKLGVEGSKVRGREDKSQDVDVKWE